MAKSKTTAKRPAPKRKSTRAKASEPVPADVRHVPLVRMVGHQGPIRSVAWSPDGTRLASGSADRTVRVWDASTGEQIRTLVDSESPVLDGLSVTWSHRGDALVAVNPDQITIWNVATGIVTLREKVRLSSYPTAVWSGDDQTLLASGRRGVIVTIDVARKVHRRITTQSGSDVYTLFLGARTLVAGTEHGDLFMHRLSDVTERLPAAKMRLLHTFGGGLFAACLSPDEQLIAVGGTAQRIWIWDLRTGLAQILEAAFGIVEHLRFSADGGVLAARGRTGDVLLWNTDDWSQLDLIPGNSPGVFPGGLAFHPSNPVLAMLSDSDLSIQLWRIARDARSGLSTRTPESVRYQNAKVVLVGNSGVGKSGLAMVLAAQPFAATESTHARRVVQLDRAEVHGSTTHKVARETLLWDLAGQPGYRLVHQIQMADAVVALVLFDARSETDPFGDAAYWSQALDQARTGSNIPLIKYLVAARTDRGGVGVSQHRIDEFVKSHGFAGFFRTSAKTGEGVVALAEAVRDAIPWDKLPMVSSTRIFTDAMTFIKEVRADARAPRVQAMNELFAAFQGRRGTQATETEFTSCLRRLESTDEVDILVFSAIDEQAERRDHVLLDPGYVDAYASSVVTAAKDEPDGIGHLREADILACQFPMDPAERLPDPAHERLVLVATVEFFVEHEIALRERIDGEDYLVFPSQYTRDAPFPGSQSFGVSYEFAGPVRIIFMTLIVRLAHATEYPHRDFWRDAACFHSARGGKCIVLFQDLGDGRGRLSVFFEADPPPEVQRTFLEYVYGHISTRAVPDSVTRGRAYHCGYCRYRMDEAVVEIRLRAGKRDIACPQCDTRSPLYDLLFSDSPPSEVVADQIQQIDDDARRAKMREQAVIAIRGKIQAGVYDVFLSYRGDERARVLEIAENLQAIGLRPWVDVWDLVPGRPWQEELEKAIGSIKTAAIFFGANGLGPWEDREMRAFLEEFVRVRARVIPILLPGAADQPLLPIFLRAFTWVDLRRMSPSNLEDLRPLIAGIIDQRPGDDVLGMVERSLAERVSRPEDRGTVVTLAIRHDVSTLTPDDLDAIRAQMTQQIGTTDRGVQIAGTSQYAIRLTIGARDDVERLFKLVRHRDPRMIEHFTRWTADPDRFLADHQAIEAAILAARTAERELARR